MSEQWRPVVGYEGLYEVSDAGRIHSIARTTSHGRPVRSRILSTKVDKFGHHRVGLNRDGRNRTHLVHALVCAAFIGPRPEGMEVAHWDDDKDNNTLANLRYATRSENLRDAIRNGRNYWLNRTGCSNGHAYEDGTWYWYSRTPGKRKRVCRECFRAQGERRLALKEASA